MSGLRPFAVTLLALSLAGLFGGGSALDALCGAGSTGGAEARGARLCEYRIETGRPCLGCGGTRALRRMSRGDWRSALAANPLGAYAGLALWLLALGGLGAAITGRPAVVKVSLGIAAALAPAAFVWNAWSWWLLFRAGP